MDSFAAVMKVLTNNDTHKFAWKFITNLDYNTSYASFPNIRCETLNKTMHDYINSTKK